MVAFTAFDYRDCDIGPYNEFSIAFLIAFLITFCNKSTPLFTALQQMTKGELFVYVWLPKVITEIARARSVGLYGYPKYLSDINFSTKEENIEDKWRSMVKLYWLWTVQFCQQIKGKWWSHKVIRSLIGLHCLPLYWWAPLNRVFQG